MQRKILTVSCVIPLATGVLFLLWLMAPGYLPWKVAYWSEIRQGDRIIAEIERFSEVHSRLPDPATPDEVIPLGFELRVGYEPGYCDDDS